MLPAAFSVTTPPVTATEPVPLIAVPLICVTLSVSPSTSLSFARTAMVTAVSSAVVKLSATATVNGTVTAVNDAPVNTLPGSIGSVAQGAAVTIPGLSVGDVDAGTAPITTTLSVAHGTLLAGTVTGGATITGSGTASLTLTGTLAQVNATLGAISYTSAARYAGAETLTITTSDGQATDTDTLALTVSQVTTGVVIDGYVAGAQIFFDANGNGVYDDGEVVATTDAQGRFALVGEPKGTMIALGGVNTDTGLPNTIVMKAPAGATAITPLTTLVANLVEAGADPAAAQAQVVRSFGLPAGTDLGSFDFLRADADPTLGFAVQKAATQIATLMIQAKAAGADAGSVGVQLAQMTANGAIDLGNPAVLGSVLTSAGVSATVAASVAQTAAAINQAVASATTPGDLVNTVRDLNQPDANLPPVTLADVAKFGLGIETQIAVLSNDTDKAGDVLRIVAIDGKPIVPGGTVEIEHGTVTLGEGGILTFTPAAGFMGSQPFTYTVADQGGATATGVVTASLDAPVLHVAADQIDFAVAHAPELAAAGVVTIDAAADVAALNDTQAHALVEAGIHFVEQDAVTMQAEGTHLTTTLKGLQALHVDAIAVGAGVGTLVVEAGGSLESIDAKGLPSFVAAQSDASLDVTLTVDGGTLTPGADLSSLAASLRAAGIDHLGVAGDGLLSLDMGQAQTLADAGLTFTAAAEVTLTVDPAQAVQIADDSALLAKLDTLGVDHLDATGAVAITDTQAAHLVSAGIDFVEADDVTMSVEGTHMATTLKGLQGLHVDAIAVGAGVAALTVDAGGTLADIAAGDLPSFTEFRSDASLDVTLTVDGGALAATTDLTGLAAGLRAAGIDHLGVAGDGMLSLDMAQAQSLSGAGLDFTAAAEVTLTIDPAQAVQIADDSALLAKLDTLGVDHLDASGAVAITETQAAGLIGAGLDFVAADDVTLNVEGTHMATTLKGLQGLHVDAIAVGVGVTALTVEAGGTLGDISAADLPSFVLHQSDAALDVTLTVDAGTLDRGFDLAALTPALAEAGIDHIGVGGTGEIGLSLQQAWGVSTGGLDFTQAADVTVHLATGELAAITEPGEAALLGQIHVDTIDMIDDRADMTDDQAANLIAAGLHFADNDFVTVEAQGTHLSTSLRGLHDLKVDAVAVAAGVTTLVIDAGDLTGIEAKDLPLIEVPDDQIDVTLRVDGSELGDIARLAAGLAQAGIDHIVTNQDLSLLDPAMHEALDAITRQFGIDFGYQPFEAMAVQHVDTAAAQVDAGLLLELRQGYEGVDDDGVGGVYRIADGAHHALAESGLLRAYTADTLVIDGTQSADKLLTTLKDIADMGVDEVRLADGKGAPVYVDLGLHDEGAEDIRALLRSLGHGQSGPDPIFHGSEKVALVLDADAAHALAGVEGAVEQLKAIGFTEIDVLADANGTTAPAFGDAGMEVKLIGQDDELYRHLHHDR